MTREGKSISRNVKRRRYDEAAALADKKAKRIMWRGKEVDGEEVVREAAKRHEEFAAVTPDTMITCNVCGNRIRVGRAIANQ